MLICRYDWCVWQSGVYVHGEVWDCEDGKLMWSLKRSVSKKNDGTWPYGQGGQWNIGVMRSRTIEECTLRNRKHLRGIYPPDSS